MSTHFCDKKWIARRDFFCQGAAHGNDSPSNHQDDNVRAASGRTRGFITHGPQGVSRPPVSGVVVRCNGAPLRGAWLAVSARGFQLQAPRHRSRSSAGSRMSAHGVLPSAAVRGRGARFMPPVVTSSRTPAVSSSQAGNLPALLDWAFPGRARGFFGGVA